MKRYWHIYGPMMLIFWIAAVVIGSVTAALTWNYFISETHARIFMLICAAPVSLYVAFSRWDPMLRWKNYERENNGRS